MGGRLNSIAPNLRARLYLTSPIIMCLGCGVSSASRRGRVQNMEACTRHQAALRLEVRRGLPSPKRGKRRRTVTLAAMSIIQSLRLASRPKSGMDWTHSITRPRAARHRTIRHALDDGNAILDRNARTANARACSMVSGGSLGTCGGCGRKAMTQAVTDAITNRKRQSMAREVSLVCMASGRPPQS